MHSHLQMQQQKSAILNMNVEAPLSKAHTHGNKVGSVILAPVILLLPVSGNKPQEPPVTTKDMTDKVGSLVLISITTYFPAIWK